MGDSSRIKILSSSRQFLKYWHLCFPDHTVANFFKLELENLERFIVVEAIFKD